MRDLGRGVVISKSGLTGLVDRMEREGLVQRSGDPGDRRIVHVTLTPEGQGSTGARAPTTAPRWPTGSCGTCRTVRRT
jgi:DNA-binding HxlR family transcriptional regulator